MRVCLFTAVLCFAFSSCSAVERHTYFTAALDPSFAGPPDHVTFKAGDRWLTVDTDQGFEPYLVGPWFASVIPVFPLTWLVKALPPHYLALTFDADPTTLRYLRSANLLVLVASNPKSSQTLGGALGRHALPNQARFAVDPRALTSFTLRLPRLGNPADDFDVPFTRAERWAWVQHMP